MEDLLEKINKLTNLEFTKDHESRFKGGQEVLWLRLKINQISLSFLLMPFYDGLDFRKHLKTIENASSFEKVIVYAHHILPEQMKKLKAKKIGFFDSEDNFYIPIEIESEGRPEVKNSRLTSNTINEFYLGLLMLSGNGIWTKTQKEAADFIGKSVSTVNLTLRQMLRDGYAQKVANGYEISNVDVYFNRWLYLYGEFQKTHILGRFKSSLSPIQINDICEHSKFQKISLGGSSIDELRGESYLRNTRSLSIYVNQFDETLLDELDLEESEKGWIQVYECYPLLRELKNSPFVNNLIVIAELLLSKDPREREAGEIRKDNFLNRVKEAASERFALRYL